MKKTNLILILVILFALFVCATGVASATSFNDESPWQIFTKTGTTFDQYVLTEGSYSEKADLDSAVQEEFGPEAEVADWEEITKFSGQIAAFCDAVGLVSYGDDAMVYRGGAGFWDSRRHYLWNDTMGTHPLVFKFTVISMIILSH